MARECVERRDAEKSENEENDYLHSSDTWKQRKRESTLRWRDAEKREDREQTSEGSTRLPPRLFEPFEEKRGRGLKNNFLSSMDQFSEGGNSLQSWESLVLSVGVSGCPDVHSEKSGLLQGDILPNLRTSRHTNTQTDIILGPKLVNI